MSILNRVKKNASREREAESGTEVLEQSFEDSTSSSSRTKKKTVRGTLAEIVDTTTVPPAVTDLISAEEFTVDGGSIAFLFDVAGIGGLSKKDARSEDKGQLQTAIKNGVVRIYGNDELLMDNKFILLPTEQSIRILDEEYSMFKSETALFTPVLVDTTSMQEFSYEMVEVAPEYTDGVPFEDIVAISAGDLSVTDLLVMDGEQNAASESVEDTPENEIPDEAVENLESEVDEIPEEEPPFDPEGEDSWFDQQTFYDPDADTPDDLGIDLDDEAEVSAGAEEQNDEEPSVFTTNYEADERIIGTEDVEQALTQVVRGGGVELSLDMAAFNQRFRDYRQDVDLTLHNDEISDYLSGQVAVLNTNADLELINMRNTHDAQLAQNFQVQAQEAVLKALKQTSLETIEVGGTPSPYAQLMSKIAQWRDEARNTASEYVAKEQERIREEFAASVAEAGEAARIAREAQFKEQYRTRHEREVADVPLKVNQAIEDKYNNEVAQLKERAQRAAEAVYADTLEMVLYNLTTEDQAHQEAQATFITEHADQISQLVRESMEKDFARSETLAKQLERSNELAALKEAHGVDLANLHEEYATVLDGKTAEAEEAAAAHLAALHELETQFKVSHEALEASLASAQKDKKETREELREINKDRKFLNEQLLSADQRAKVQADKAYTELEASHQKEVDALNKRIVEIQSQKDSTTKTEKLMLVMVMVMIFVTALILGINFF